jgi:hypothetical protein
MSEATASNDDRQLDEFVALLAMLPESERYQIAVEIVDIAEKHGGAAQSG